MPDFYPDTLPVEEEEWENVVLPPFSAPYPEPDIGQVS